MWLCQCECGTIKLVGARNLTRNKSKSCGCGWKTWVPANKLPDGAAAFNSLFGAYKRRARETNREFTLSEEEFKSFIFDDCYYCGVKPQTKTYSRSIPKSKDFIVNNGIDRIDSNLGYIKENCVTCCSDCNYLKTDFPISEFFEKIKLIYKKHFEEK
jgi:hypothetical protein